MKKLIIQITIQIMILGTSVSLGSDSNDIITSLDALINSARIREHPPQIGINNEDLRTSDPCKVLNLSRYRLIAGHRRFAACRRAGLKKSAGSHN